MIILKLEILRELENNDCHVSFSITDITNEDNERLKDFGKPRLAIGGTIPLDASNSFKISNEERIIPDTFEFTKIFKSIEYGEDTIAYAEAYITEIKSRVNTAIQALEAKTDTFSGKEIVQL